MGIMIDAGCKKLPKNKVIGYWVDDRGEYLVSGKTKRKIGRTYFGKYGQTTQIACPKYPKCKGSCRENVFIRFKKKGEK